MAHLRSLASDQASARTLPLTFRIAGQSLADLARTERAYGDIADRLWRAGIDPAPPLAARDIAEARERVWRRLKWLLGQAQAARRHAGNSADPATTRHWRRIARSRRAEAGDHLPLLRFCRTRHAALRDPAAALPLPARSWRKSHAG